MKVAETAKHLGIEFKVATNTDALERLLEPRPQPWSWLILWHVVSPSTPILKLLAASKDIRVVAFSFSRATKIGRAGQKCRLRRRNAAVELHTKSGPRFCFPANA